MKIPSTSASFRATLGAIKRRIKRKKRAGEQLDYLEKHLERTLHIVEGRFSSRRAFVSWLRFSALKPMIVFTIGLYTALGLFIVGQEELIFASDLSDANLEVSVSSKQDPTGEQMKRMAEETLEADIQTVVYQPPAELHPNVQEQIHQVNFLCGLISGYRPGVKDCGKIAQAIVKVSAEESIDPFYVAAIVATESSFYTHARSSVGARGLMQLMPRTAKELTEQMFGQKSYPQLANEETNVRLGVEYIKRMERRYRGNRYFALAAYNWGPANVDKVKQNKKTIPRSVKGYANKILARTNRWNKLFKRSLSSVKVIKEAKADREKASKA